MPSMLTIYYTIIKVKYKVNSKKISITQRPLFSHRGHRGLRAIDNLWLSYSKHVPSTSFRAGSEQGRMDRK